MPVRLFCFATILLLLLDENGENRCRGGLIVRVAWVRRSNVACAAATASAPAAPSPATTGNHTDQQRDHQQSGVGVGATARLGNPTQAERKKQQGEQREDRGNARDVWHTGCAHRRVECR